jgi:exoribonuclease R
VNAKYPRVRIETRQRDTLMDKRIVVVIDAWPATSHFPLGHYTRTLGVVGDRVTETDVRTAISTSVGVDGVIWPIFFGRPRPGPAVGA